MTKTNNRNLAPPSKHCVTSSLMFKTLAFLFLSSVSAYTLKITTPGAAGSTSSSCQISGRDSSSLGRMHHTAMKALSGASGAGFSQREPKIAIVGAGAAGLAAARVFSRNGFEPVVLEKAPYVGGVWKYVEGKPNLKSKDENKHESSSSSSSSFPSTLQSSSATSTGPMYRGLRTNLPKELMAFREFPFRSTISESYVSHKHVHGYLQEYQENFSLSKYISFNCQVTKLSVLKDSTSILSPPATSDDEGGKTWPQFRVEWEQEVEDQLTPNSSGNESSATQKTTKTIQHKETFDAVCICNGHYAKPSMLQIPGIDLFSGKIMHSIDYDDPREFKDLVVLCVGARASGVDLAREMGEYAAHVYLSDSTCPNTSDDNKGFVPQTTGKTTLLPTTKQIQPDGSILFDFNFSLTTKVDVIIVCTGYDYSFPFISHGQQNAEGKQSGQQDDVDDQLLKFTTGERRVTPLYEQLWHAKYPTLALIGIPHSVVPFPLFEFQAEAVYSQWLLNLQGQPNNLPAYHQRVKEAATDAMSGGATGGRVPQDTHFLGNAQWDYCRKLARLAGNYDEQIENYIATNKAIYDQAGKERKSAVPGGPDNYRETRFERDDENQSFKILNPISAAAH